MEATPVNRRRLATATVAAFVLVAALMAPAAAALTYAEASGSLPASAVFGCNFPDNRSCNPSPDGGWSGVALGDVNADGFDDLVASGRLQYGFHAYLSDGMGGWTESSAGFAPSDCHGRSDVALRDVDGDGDLDLGGVAGINGPPVVYLNDGTGSWTRLAFGLDDGSGEGFAFGDFDGDGLPDLAIVGHSFGGAWAWLSDDAEAWVATSSGLPTADSGHVAATGDFDCDGRDELVTTLYFGHGVQLWSLGVDLTWTERTAFPWEQAYGVVTGDVNGDGALDVVAANAQDRIGGMGNWGSIHVYLGAGDGATFTESSAGLPFEDVLYSDVELGDLDTDGDVDIVAGTWDGLVRVFLNDGATRWSEALGTGLPNFNQKIETIALGDVDGDCGLDVAVAAYSCGLRVYRRTDPAPCALAADAGRPPCSRACGMDVTLDASGSRACACPPGEARYRWTRDGTVVRDWDASPVATDTPIGDSSYRVDVACASDLTCFVSDSMSLLLGSATAPAIMPPRATICAGETVRLAVPGPWASVSWSTDPPGESGDGAAGPALDASPMTTTTYRAVAVDAAGCGGEGMAVVEVLPDPLPGPVGPSLRVRRDGPRGVRLTWTDLPGTWGGYEVVALRRDTSLPWPDVLDGPVPSVAAIADVGMQEATDDDAIGDASWLTYMKVRATSPCAHRPGTTCNGFLLQRPPCP